MKPCTKCNAEKAYSDFYSHPTCVGGVASVCRSCMSERSAIRYKRDREKILAKNAAYVRDNTEKRKEYNKRWLLKSQYGLSVEDHDRMVLAQGGCCAICGRKTVGSLQVDHNHTTNEVRGLLCGPCNRGIGLLGDSVDTLRRAIEYLDTKLGNI